MSLFSVLPPKDRLLIAGLFFAVVTAELFLFLYRRTVSRSFFGRPADFLKLSASIALLDFLSIQAGLEEGQCLIRIPWGLLVLVFILLFGWILFRIQEEHVILKNSLSPFSVRQALDDLGTGISYANANGRIVLINRAMRQVISGITGAVPYTEEDIRKALEGRREPETADIYRLDETSVRRIRTAPMEGGPQGFVCTTAQDITELYNAAEALEADNRKLEQTIARMKEMYDRLADRVREQEALVLKIKVHDEIGSSLIAISELMEKNPPAELEAQMRVLRNAVSYFSGGTATGERQDFEAVRQRAEELGVTLAAEGAFPDDSRVMELVSIAARECVTNCIRHAKGSLVNVRITEQDGRFLVSITNNGIPPQGKIREGGGLSSVRRRVEEAGGVMRILQEPQFELQLELLPEREL